MTIFWLIAMQAAQAPIIYTPHGYPPRLAVGSREPQSPFTVEIEARAGAQLIWQGSLRIGSQYPASFDRVLTEAPPANCSALQPPFTANRSAVRIRFSTARSQEAPPRLSVNVNWERPSENCDQDSQIQKNVEISGIIELPADRSVILQGDGGLTVRLTRK